MPEPITILLAVDARQVIGCAVTMRSILAHAARGPAVHFLVLTPGLPAADTAALAATVAGAGRAAHLDVRPVDLDRFHHLMRSKSVTHTTYARLLMDEVLPPGTTRCIYLDCDMVVTRDIAEAWRFPLDGRTAAAVPNGSVSDTRDNQVRIGLAEPRYFNAGFMVIDVARWRERAVSARAIRHAEALGDRLVLHDQDALNRALEGDWVDLPREWNAGIPVSDWLTESSAAVFHYWGAPKPWDADYRGRFRGTFERYLDLTPYRGMRPWNPFGLGAVWRRLRRAIPYGPALWRAMRGRIGLEKRPAPPSR